LIKQPERNREYRYDSWELGDQSAMTFLDFKKSLVAREKGKNSMVHGVNTELHISILFCKRPQLGVCHGTLA
jgi:hypothetical protein